MAHSNTIIPVTLDLFQFAFRPNRSTDDAISIALPHCLHPPGQRNTIVPSKRITKLRTLRLNTSLCNWILDFLTGHPQAVRVGNNLYTTLTINMGAPQGCVLSLLYSLFTPDCVAANDSKHHRQVY
jgi:hypothetical protein